MDDPFGKTSETLPLRFTRVLFGVTPGPFILNAAPRYQQLNMAYF